MLGLGSKRNLVVLWSRDKNEVLSYESQVIE